MAIESLFGVPRAAARPADNDDKIGRTYLQTLRDAYLPAEWSERVVVTVAVTAAVTVVALIAVLMGSIGP